MRELIKSELNKGITQRDLAGKLHFSHSTIQKILFTETKHSYDIRKKVADYFHVPVSDFYDDNSIPSGQPEHPLTAAPVPPPAGVVAYDLLFKALMDRIEAQGETLDFASHIAYLFQGVTKVVVNAGTTH